MRHFDLTPLYRSTVGFDRLASVLDNVLSHDTAAPTYPPYNIEIRARRLTASPLQWPAFRKTS